MLARLNSPAEIPKNMRVATERDEQALYQCLIELWKDNFLGFPVSPAKVWSRIKTCSSGKGGIAGIIDGPNGEIVATVGIFFNEMWYSDQAYLSEFWLFVDPRYRNLGYADDLAAFTRWYRHAIVSASDGSRLPLLTGVTSMKRLAAKERWWGKWSLKVGALFLVDGN
jgi:GNAT superfamily N-acetyltransferase